ncbi:DNA-directed RNA polymerase subunit alpha C-terminal domain-containing protein [Nonomuraea dietziae]|uniref:DNA-directed RNA polymerase subunit alpha C-terminal domain-containing protein n=1 Tax=Nonomuraea dietziae TaxID=65515 RepID=UPI0031DBA82F
MADEKKTRWFEPVEFAAKARGPGGHARPAGVGGRAGARCAAPAGGAESVKDLLYLGEERLAEVPGLGAKSVEEIRRRVREAGLIFK